jgi:hypothetical protein
MDRQRRRHRDQAPPLDLTMADRLLSGALSPQDVPPALGPMARAIDALRPEASPEDSKREEDDQRTIGSMVSFLAAASRHPASRFRLPAPPVLPRRVAGFRVRMATAVVGAALAFLLGVAYAGQLPGPAQNVVSVALAKVGLSVPRHDKAAEGKHQADDQDGSNTEAAVGPDPSGPAHHGLCNAYFNGQGGMQGGKFNSVAFQNVQDAAADAGQTPEEFCGVQSSPPGTGDEHGKGKGKGHHNDQQGAGHDKGDNEHGRGDENRGNGSSGNQGEDGGAESGA